MHFDIKKAIPHFIAIVIFVIVSVIYCKPSLQGKVLNQQDTQGWKGMAQQSFEYKEKHGYFPLWTNSMFSGMPAYQIAFDPQTEIGVGLSVLTKIFSLGLPEPISYFFLACLCFYILCIVAGANTFVSIMGAIAYAYSTYNPIIVSVGHNTKMLSIAYAPMILAGLMLLFQKKYLLGFVVTAFFSSVLIGQNHLQIVYYTLITAGVFTIAYIIKSFNEKKIADAFKAPALGIMAGIIGLATCAVIMMPTYEYAKESMRGGISQLTIGEKHLTNKTKGGLDKDYAFNYSFDKMETFTFIVPGLYGGSNGGDEYSASSKFVEKLSEIGVNEEYGLSMANGYSYWGNQQPTSGPVYVGAVICFLFVLGMFYLKSWHKWWLLAASLIGILLAWGSNFKELNYFLFDHLPYYNKFRAPAMAMVIPQLCFPLMGVLAVNKLFDKETDWVAAFKKLKISAIFICVILAILGIFYFTSDFSGKNDSQIKDNFKRSILQQVPPGQQPPPQLIQQADETSRSLVKALKEDRKGLMGSDLLRTILLIAITATLIGLYIKRKINSMLLCIGLILLSGFDLISVDRRYLNYNNYREAEEFEANFTPTPADAQILSDPDHDNFRVFNESPDFTNESITSYHHNSIGGYHPAKLGLYQDIIEHQISKGNMQVINMLNTKYIITHDQNGRPLAQLNPGAFGNCWLVKGIKFVNSANEEMLALDSTNLKDTVIINNDFQYAIKQIPQYDSTAFIKIVERLNDRITYNFSASAPQFAVFSEVYYSMGWNAFIDGQKTDYAKVNYILRGLNVPAGKHAIEFRFEPRSFTIGRTITIWSTIFIYLMIVITLISFFKRNK